MIVSRLGLKFKLMALMAVFENQEQARYGRVRVSRGRLEGITRRWIGRAMHMHMSMGKVIDRRLRKWCYINADGRLEEC